MADNYLITGYWGEPHVTAENDRGINAAIFGAGRFVLPVGEQFKAEYIGNNTIRVYDGKLVDNGAVAGIPAGKYVDVLISEAGQGMNRNDLIVFQYSKDTSTLVEKGSFVVVKGTETSGTAADPALTEGYLLSDSATFDQMALWRVSVSTATISTPVQVFTVLNNIQEVANTANKKAPKDHSSSYTTYGVSTASKYGHAKASTTTPKAPGTAAAGSETSAFSRGDHVHPEQVSAHGITTAGSGSAYTATVEGITALTAGASFIMIPHTISTSSAPTLNVNGLGAKTIRRRLSDNSTTTVSSAIDDWLGANKPVRVTYNGTYWIAELARPNATDIYGVVGFEHGGHGGTTVEEARENLGIITLDELPNLYIWKKYSGGNPNTINEETVTSAVLSKSDTGYTSGYAAIEYSDEITVRDGTLSLVASETITSVSKSIESTIQGKYVRSVYYNTYYYIPSDATLSQGGGSTLGYLLLQVSSAKKLTVSGENIGFVASKKSTTYPTNGEHTDGYWYEYHKQLGE